MKGYKLKIGLEIHVQVNTKSKLFSKSSTAFTASPNEHINYFDLGIPGVLPLLNEGVMQKAICAGKILNCTINKRSRFDRKHYVYPDLPLGFQITQFYEPICSNGHVTLSNGVLINIERIHIETDAGKLIHDDHGYKIDYNRCGNPLLEIVTEPNFTSADEVAEFLRILIRDLEYGDVSNCDMEKGNLRCDINISVIDPAGVNHARVEIKNVNSVEFIKSAIEFEYERQISLVEKGEKYTQHTRGYRNGETKFMRDKETAEDYRYTPCGNLPKIILSQEYIDSVVVPETYTVKFEKYNAIFNNIEITQKILSDFKLVQYFENSVEHLRSLRQTVENSHIKLIANFIACDLTGLCKDHMKPYISLVTYQYIALIVNHLVDEKITTRVAKDILIESFAFGVNPIDIVKTRGLEKISDESKICELIEEAKTNDVNMFEKWVAGEDKYENALVAYAMKKTKGSIDLNKFKDILHKKYRR